MNVNEQLSGSCSFTLNVFLQSKVEDGEQLSVMGLIYHEAVPSGLHLCLLTLPTLLHPGCCFCQDQYSRDLIPPQQQLCWPRAGMDKALYEWYPEK